MREFALWNFTYGESIEAVRPWVVTNEGNLWFTKKKDENTVYVFIMRTPWKMGERKKFSLRSVRATASTQLSVLGSDGKILEYQPEADAASHFRQDEKGLHLDVIMAQRLYNERKWPDPLVLKLTNVEAGLRPPVVATGAGKRTAPGAASLNAELTSLGQASAVEVGFEYRRRKGTEELLNAEVPWTATPLKKLTGPGAFSASVNGLGSEVYEFRPVVKHPLLTVAGEERAISDK